MCLLLNYQNCFLIFFSFPLDCSYPFLTCCWSDPSKMQTSLCHTFQNGSPLLLSKDKFPVWHMGSFNLLPYIFHPSDFKCYLWLFEGLMYIDLLMSLPNAISPTECICLLGKLLLILSWNSNTTFSKSDVSKL